MPPKSKKQQEEEAKRLQAERLRQEEQLRLIELEKSKYASTKISTGLTLPVTALLLEQFSSKPVSFVSQKLIQYLTLISPHITNNPIGLKIILNQILSNIMFALDNFGVTHKDEKTRYENLEKARVFVGIMMQVLKNDHPWFIEDNLETVKSKQKDWILFKQLILRHSYDGPPQRIKYFSKEIVQKIISYAEMGYFGHYNLLMKFDRFSKKQEVKKEIIYIDRPQLFFNNKQTQFVDLSKPKQSVEMNQSQSQPQVQPIQ